MRLLISPFRTVNAPSQAIAILALAIVFLTPQHALAQDKAKNRATLNFLQEAFVDIAEELEPAVVTVTAKKTVRARADKSGGEEEDIAGLPFGRSRSSRTFRSQGTGTGLIISTDGWILTNDHVIGGADKV